MVQAPPIIRRFRYTDITAATSNFHPTSLLGRGSHGAVYRAILDDGHLVAAAKLIPAGESSDHLSPCNEVKILSTVHHRRLVNLLGYASGDGNHVAIVELMPNGTLEELLHGEGVAPMTWARRVRIARQAAEGVRKLHGMTEPVIHRDIKSSNVLIDRKGNARVGDFGLAVRDGAGRLPPAGTMGYIDPSYVSASYLSTKVDVFSFGVLLLEILTGRRPIDVDYTPPSVVEWVTPLVEAGAFRVLWDGRIRPPDLHCDRALSHAARLARRCVSPKVEERPTMAEVVAVLRMVEKKISPKKSLHGLCKKTRHQKFFCSKKVYNVSGCYDATWTCYE